MEEGANNFFDERRVMLDVLQENMNRLFRIFFNKAYN
jgi:hypothetical protein